MLPITIVTVYLLVNLRLVGFYAPETVMIGLPVCALLIHVTWSIRCAYRDYLRMDHSLGVAVASMTIAVLGTVTLFDFLGPGNLAASILVAINDVVAFL